MPLGLAESLKNLQKLAKNDQKNAKNAKNAKKSTVSGKAQGGVKTRLRS